MDLDKIKNIFKDHASNYDMNDIAINRKFYHSYRVMDLCLLLAKYNNFSDENTEIAMLVGLLHDYSRFEQWAKYKTYSDKKSIDHGDLAVERLFRNNEILKFCENPKYYDEIYDAIKYHNKYSVPDFLTPHNKLLCNIIRDADKLDIYYLYSMNKDLFKEDSSLISDKVKEEFFKNHLINHNDVNSRNDSIILSLAMVYDLNFNYSFEYLYKRKLIDRLYDSIENKELFSPYFEHIKKYIEERIDENAR